MTTILPTLPATTVRPRTLVAPAVSPAGLSHRGRVLAFVAPLALFVHGILAWVLGLGTAAATGDATGNATSAGQGMGTGTGQSTGTVSLALGADLDGADVARLGSVASGLTLVLAVGAFCWLVGALGTRLQHLPVAAPATVVAAFGAGATAAVWLGQTTGLLDASLPAALVAGGPALVGVGLAAVLGSLVLEGRLPAGSAALAGVGALAVALPWGLLPLGALLLLIALGPLTRPAGEPA